MRADVVIVGAGVQGCSVALRPAQAGRKVVVLERSIPGAEASSAAAGILSPGVEAGELGAFYALCRASLWRWPGFAGDVESLSGMTVAFRGGGTLEIALDDAHAAVLASRAEAMIRRELPVQVLDDEALRRLESHPGAETALVLFGQGDRQLCALMAVSADHLAGLAAGSAVIVPCAARICFTCHL